MNEIALKTTVDLNTKELIKTLRPFIKNLYKKHLEQFNGLPRETDIEYRGNQIVITLEG